ncbi:MAG: hypothetical protein CMB80_00755 [Flammeovirgaceae bacterium]|nr:hypothetical protein [Flammeovirgaceae bacterium]|tara:strand:+ start:1661 stop:2308 length:648 start_codon:yes stop_codon:yes gene_type:complete
MSFKWERYSSIQGWCVEEKAEYFYNHVIENKPEFALEIGLFGGKSFLPLADAMKKNAKGLCIGVEPWNSAAALEGDNGADSDLWWSEITPRVWDDVKYRLDKEIKDRGLESHTELYQETSQTFIKTFADSDRTLDFLHIDGNHCTAKAMFDVQTYVPFLNTGGFLVLDDMDWAQLVPVVRYIEHEMTELQWIETITRNQVGSTSCGIYKYVPEKT